MARSLGRKPGGVLDAPSLERRGRGFTKRERGKEEECRVKKGKPRKKGKTFVFDIRHSILSKNNRMSNIERKTE